MQDDKKMISAVVPCFNEESNVRNTYEVLTGILASVDSYDYEIIFVDNFSEDKSAEIMKEIASSDTKVTAVMLSRNFGPESSGLAGMNQASGDAIILMAADLQDPPELIPKFVAKWEQGYDVVLGQAKTTNDNKLILALRRTFYRVLRKVSYVDIPLNVSGFGLVDKKVNQAISNMPEKSRFYRGLIALAGFKHDYIQYERPERKYGETTYNFRRYIEHAEKGLFSFTTLPLDIITLIGIFLVALSILAIFIYIIWVFAFGNPITGSVTLLLGIIFFGSINLLAISIVGKYIGIIFEETKNRPHYIIKEIIQHKK